MPTTSAIKKEAEKAADTVADKVEEAITTSLTEKVAASAHRAIDQAAPSLEKIEENLRTATHSTTEKIADQKHLAQESLAANVTRAKIFARKNPLLTLGAAFAAGIAVTSLLKARK